MIVAVLPSAVLVAVLAAAQALGPSSAPELNILSLMTFHIHSHHIWMAPLTVRLAELGHHVVAVDIKEFDNRPPSLNVSVIESANVEEPKLIRVMNNGTVFEKLRMLLDIGLDKCALDMKTPTMARLMETAFVGKFDVVLVDYSQSHCFLGLAHLFDCPVVALTPFPKNYWMDLLMGIPPLPAMLPLVFLSFDTPMSFVQRLQTTLLYAYVNYVIRWENDPAMNVLNEDVFGPGIPSVEELRQRVALALVNEMPGLDPPRPLGPSTVPVGGMHIKTANLSRIPHDLAKWLDDAQEGFILMSFGSIIKGSHMDIKKRTAFINAFSKLRQRVIWKFEANDILKDLPPNVRVGKWLPQNDILAHPKIRLFISHNGGLSTQEAIFHGVPILSVPFILDQKVNAKQIRKIGIGRLLEFDLISEERLSAEIVELLSNSSYRQAAGRLSRALRDQRESPLERAVWWVEHVARHRGAPHLRSPTLDLPLHQVLLVDVIAFLALASFTILAAVLLLLGFCVRLATRQRRAGNKALKTD